MPYKFSLFGHHFYIFTLCFSFSFVVTLSKIYTEHSAEGSLLNRDFEAVKTSGSCEQFTGLNFANFLGLFTYENQKRRSECDIYLR